MNSEKIKINELADLVNGFGFEKEDWGIKGTKILRIQNLNNPFSSFNYTEREVSNKFLVNDGDILIAWAGSLGVYEWNGGEAFLNQHIYKVNFKSNKIDKNYFKYLLNFALEELTYKMHGVGLKHLKKGQLSNYEISLIDIQEQQKRVEVLNKIQTLINLRTKSVALLSEYLNSTFIKMFGDPVLDKKWTQTPFKSCIKNLKSGWSPTCENSSRITETEWAVIKQSAITKGEFNEGENKKLPNEKISQAVKQITVEKDDILFSRKNTKDLVGSTVLVQNEQKNLLIPDTIFKINLDENKLNKYYLTHLFNDLNFSKKIKQLASGSARSMANISMDKLYKLQIPSPPKEIQDYFGQISFLVFNHKHRLNRSIQLLEELFQSFLYETFKSTEVATEKDEVDELMNDDIQMEIFINTLNASDFQSVEQYDIEVEKLFKVLNRTKLKISDESFRKGIIQRKDGKQIKIEAYKDYLNDTTK